MDSTSPRQPILEMRDISKSFPGVKALDHVRLDLHAGEVTALIGENGAGKSTLVKVLTGIYRPDEGEMRLNGTALDLPTPDAARRVGITAIHQETVMFDELSVTENIFVGHHIALRFGRLDWAAMRARTKEILTQLEVELDPDTKLKTLSVAQKHIVGIARALSVDAKIVIMDEPTAALSQREIDDLYGIVRRLKREGKAILFISHKFDEVFEIADRYVVFRDGAFVGDGLIRETGQDRLVTMMVGRTIEQVFPKLEVEIGEVVLDVDGFSHPTEFADISFDVRRGEIVGFVTIGTMSLYRGISYIILGDRSYGSYPEGFEYFGQGYVLWVLSLEFTLFLVLALGFGVLLHRTSFGRRTFAIGQGPEAARFAGIDVERHRLMLFALVGLMAGLAAVLLTSRIGSTRPNIATGWELEVITMVVLGGVNIMGGSGTIPGVFIAVFLMGLVTFGMGLMNVPGIVMAIVIGGLLIAAIATPILIQRLGRR